MPSTEQPLTIRDGSDRPAAGCYTSIWLDFATFAVPTLSFVAVTFIGRLFLSDLLIIGLLGLLLTRKQSLPRLGAQLPKTFLLLGLLWLLAQVVTDLYRQTDFVDYARGWTKILLTLSHFSVLYLLLYGRPRRIVIYGWGLAAGSLLKYFFNPFINAVDYPWEFGWGFPITMAVFLLASDRSYRSLTGPILIGLTNLFLGFRSMGAACLLAAIYLLLRIIWARSGFRWSGPAPKQVIATILILSIGGWVVMTAFTKAASSGLLGEKVKLKYDFQSSGDYGMLLGARSEVLLGALAIYGSPLLGHGSWAKDPDYVFAYEAWMLQLGYDSAALQRGMGTGIDGEENDYLIGGHSHLLGAWVEAGIMGGIFWAWIFLISCKCLSRLYSTPTSIVPLAVFCTLWLLWHIIFEPYNGGERFSTIYFTVVVMSFIRPSAKNILPALSIS